MGGVRVGLMAREGRNPRLILNDHIVTGAREAGGLGRTDRKRKMKREGDLEIISSLHLSQAHKHRNSVKQMFVELEATVPCKIQEVCELGWGGKK